MLLKKGLPLLVPVVVSFYPALNRGLWSAFGDRYALPVGVDPRYATLALRAAGGPGSRASVRWFVDGRPVAGERWTLAPGRHAIRAETVRGERDEVRIDVR